MAEAMAKTSVNKTNLLRKSKGSVEDRISSLADDLLRHILSNLSTKDTIRTSVLSRRWRDLWLDVPALDLDSREFPDDCDFLEFFDKYLESNEELGLKRFKLVYDVAEHLHSDFVSRIDDVLKLGVCQLTVLNHLDEEEELVRMPLSLYSCATLVNLTLYCVVFDDPESELVSLPCLKTMHLEAVKFDGETILETLISSCLVLEDLIIITHPGDYLEIVCVRSQSLKSFLLGSTRGDECEDEDEHPGDPYVEIDAPRLEYMNISDYQSGSFIIHNIGSSAKVNIDVLFYVEYDNALKRTMIHNFLTAISTVREMTISTRTLKMISEYCESEPLPHFINLSRLHASFLESSWEMLPTFLCWCPNLHSLDLEFDCFLESEEIELSFVPRCFLSSLEFVQLKTPVTVKGTAREMKLVVYFLMNCVVLKELILSESFGNIMRKIKGIPKRSTKCKVVMLKH